MSSGGGGGFFDKPLEWIKEDIGHVFSPDMLDPRKAGDHYKNFLGKKGNDLKSAFSPGKKVNGAAGALSQVGQLGVNIQGGHTSGAIDDQTAKELWNELYTGQSEAGGGMTSYEAMVPRIGAIQERLDVIAAGSDTTVNDRQRLNHSLLSLKDRPGRSGLIMGG